MPGSSFSRVLHAAWVGIGVSAALAVATTAALATELRDVRVGVHSGYTRVVLETDARATYSLHEGTGALTVQLQAASKARSFATKGKQLAKVDVAPGVAATEVRLDLRGPVTVKEMVLTAPHRVVLDLYPGSAKAAAPMPPPRVVAEAPKPAPAPAPVAPEPVKPEPAEPVAGTGNLTAEELAAAATADAETTSAVPEPGDPMLAEPPLESDALAAGDDDEPVAPEPAAAPSEAEHAAPTPPTGGAADFLPDLLRNPVVLAAFALVFLLIFLRARARSKREDVAYASPLGPREAAGAEADASDERANDDGFTAFSGQQPDAEDATRQVSPRPSPSDDPSLFDVEPDEVEAAPPPPVPPQPERVVTFANSATLDADLGEDMAAIVRELERRLAHLETRLEEVVDSKDRLERQVSAQTEELRVQRAAIARTQRVLRTLARPEDETSDPAPKP